MKAKLRRVRTLLFAGIVLVTGECHAANGDSRELLDQFFSSAISGDYATSYACYYAEYKEKVSKEDYIRHRKEASVLQAYKIVSLKQNDDTAHAEVQLTFGPSIRLNRKEPVTAMVTEEMVREDGHWKIKVW